MEEKQTDIIENVETPVENQPVETPVETPVDNQPVETTKELPKVVQEIKAQYEAKIEAMKDEYSKEIADRDSVITQLLNGDETAVITDTVVDKINKKRNFKKW